MLSEPEILEKLKAAITPERFRHSLGVCETAAKMARRFNASVSRARLAGLLHDCARDLPEDKLLDLALAHDIEVTEEDRLVPVLLHGPVGAVIARENYGVEDREVLSAIATHTLGSENMKLLDKIIFIADMIEPGRDFPGISRLRKAACRDLDAALLDCFDQSLQYLLKKRFIIHQRTVRARNWLLRKCTNSQVCLFSEAGTLD